MNSEMFTGKKLLEIYKEKFMKDDTDRIFGEFNGSRIGLRSDKGNNIMVIGTSGRGKTYNYVMPNLLTGAESAIITNKISCIDDKDMALFAQKGVKVHFIDFSDPAHSGRYNPFCKTPDSNANERTEMLYSYLTDILYELDEDETTRNYEGQFLRMAIRYILTNDSLRTDERNIRRMFDVLIDIEDDYNNLNKYDTTKNKIYINNLRYNEKAYRILSRVIDKISIVNDAYFDCFSEYEGCDLLTAESLRKQQQYWFVHSSYGTYFEAEQAKDFFLACIMSDIYGTTKGCGVHFYLDDFWCTIPSDLLTVILERNSKAGFGVSVITQTLESVYSYCGSRDMMSRFMNSMNAVVYLGGMKQYGKITEYTRRTLSADGGVSLTEEQVLDLSEFAEKVIVFTNDNLPIICDKTEMYREARNKIS